MQTFATRLPAQLAATVARHALSPFLAIRNFCPTSLPSADSNPGKSFWRRSSAIAAHNQYCPMVVDSPAYRGSMSSAPDTIVTGIYGFIFGPRKLAETPAIVTQTDYA